MSKFQLENFVHFGQLFEIYGKLLSSDRQAIMNLYFNCNMTLVEIADEKGISRQAVLDAIKKSCDKLTEFEQTLQILKSKSELEQKLQQILKLDDIKQIKQKVEQILKED